MMSVIATVPGITHLEYEWKNGKWGEPTVRYNKTEFEITYVEPLTIETIPTNEQIWFLEDGTPTRRTVDEVYVYYSRGVEIAHG